MKANLEKQINGYKPIPNYEGLYSISENGDVYSHIKNRILSASIVSIGYGYVSLSKNKKHTSKYVHRLVAWCIVYLGDIIRAFNLALKTDKEERP